MTARTAEFTADDLRAMPDDGKRYELWAGKIVMSPAASLLHGKLARGVRRALEAATPEGLEVIENVGIQLDERTVPGPDVVVYRPPTEASTWIPADCVELIVDVNLSTQAVEARKKVAIYAHAGIPHYWIIGRSDGSPHLDI